MRTSIQRCSRALVAAPAIGLLVLLGGCGDETDPSPADPSGSSTGATGASGGAGGGGGMAEGGGGRVSACAPLPADFPTDVAIEGSGNFRTVEEFPLVGFPSRQVRIYLPDGYDGSRPYPVVYFTDGPWVFSNGYRTHLAMEALVLAGVIEPHILVGIEQSITKRTYELTPDEDPTDPSESGGGDEFATQIVERLKPFVDASFETRCGREDTTIAGFSLGGLMCWHMLLRDPEVFGKGICESPSIWWNHKSILDRMARHSGPMPLKVWMDVGTKEVLTIARLPNFPPDAQFHEHTDAIREARDLAVDKGMILGQTLGYHEQIDGPHTPFDVGKRMPGALAFALSDVSLLDRTVTGHAFHVWLDQILAPPNDNPYTLTSTVSFETRFEDPFVLTVPNTLVELSSSDQAVATIDAAGVIQSVASGTATFSAGFMGLDGTDTIEVLPPQ